MLSPTRRQRGQTAATESEGFSCHVTQLRDLLLPILRGNVFHLTTAAGLRGIKKDGLIRNNKSGKFPYNYPQSARSYARNRGYISLFDLRTSSDDQIETGLSNFNFLNPPFVHNNPVFLFISPSAYPALILWTQATNEEAWSEMFIPHIEAFYPRDIPISDVSRVISVKVRPMRNQQNSLSRRLDKAIQSLHTRIDNRRPDI
jgi:hypothetical protein